MTKRNIGQEILEGIQDIRKYKAGKKDLRTHTLKEPAPPQVIRARLKLSQAAFAGLMGVSVRTVQDWEQHNLTQLFCITMGYFFQFGSEDGQRQLLDK